MKKLIVIFKKVFFFLTIGFFLLSMTSCKKRVEIEPITRVSGEVYCIQETEQGSVGINASVSVEGNVDDGGDKPVTVNPDLNFTWVSSNNKRWGCYGAGAYKGHLVRAAVQADAVSLKKLVDKYIDCGQHPFPATLSIYDRNNNGLYDKNRDDVVVSYVPPQC